MSRISSTGITTSAGLISGIPIEQTVDQLIAVSARPRNQLAERNRGLSAERAAIDQLSSLTLATQFSASRLNLSSTFSARSVSSSDTDAVSARLQAGATPPRNSYSFTPIRQATANQIVSGRIDDLDDLGGGELAIRLGGQVDRGVSLSSLNGGTGVPAGEIRITDRDGLSARVDLRAAQTIDDVIAEINAADVDVTASTDGDRLVLTDTSGGSGNLRVREVNNGSTAASLGLLQSVGADTLTGDDVYSISTETRLSSLRDGIGIPTLSGVADALTIELADGATSATIDLTGATKLGDVIDAINSSEELAGKLEASINSSGDGLVLNDTSGGDGDLLVSGETAVALGINSSAGSGVTINGDRLISGLQDTLVSSLRGGSAVLLGEISITDRSGSGVILDLSGAETLSDVIDIINAGTQSASGGPVAVSASLNSSRSGILLTDSSGGTGNFSVGNTGSTSTADLLGLTSNATTDTIDGGNLDRAQVSRGTRLEDFNNGRGVRLGNFKITDSAGRTSTITLQQAGNDAETLGDVIDRVNAAGVSVVASLNESGDGILLTDTAEGGGTLSVEESGSGNAAADLGLLGESISADSEGRQTIDGTTGVLIDLSDLDNSAAATRLSSLNSGDGVDLGVFEITASNGVVLAVDLGVGQPNAITIGDVIDRINEAAANAVDGVGIALTASLNESQTGIVLKDETGGGGQLVVADTGSTTTAADLRLIRTEADSDNATIDGAGLFQFDSEDTLATLVDRINNADAGVTAAIFDNGDGLRLSITSDRSGSGNEILIDGFGTLGFTETSRAGDAAALFGGVNGTGGFVVTSETNDFEGTVDGVDLTINRATGDPVTIDVAADNSGVSTAIQSFVDAYNSLRDLIDTQTEFDADSGTTGLLFGRSEVVRVDSDLSRLVTDRYFIDGQATSLQAIGLSVDENGRLALDTTKLNDALADSSQTVENLFRDEKNGFVTRLNETVDRIAGDTGSLLSARSESLTRSIDTNTQRLEVFDLRLERERESLLLQFIRLEETIGLLQSNTSFLDSIQGITIAGSSSPN